MRRPSVLSKLLFTRGRPAVFNLPLKQVDKCYLFHSHLCRFHKGLVTNIVETYGVSLVDRSCKIASKGLK